jgi:hypothetical protein
VHGRGLSVWPWLSLRHLAFVGERRAAVGVWPWVCRGGYCCVFCLCHALSRADGCDVCMCARGSGRCSASRGRVVHKDPFITSAGGSKSYVYDTCQVRARPYYGLTRADPLPRSRRHRCARTELTATAAAAAAAAARDLRRRRPMPRSARRAVRSRSSTSRGRPS